MAPKPIPEDKQGRRRVANMCAHRVSKACLLTVYIAGGGGERKSIAYCSADSFLPTPDCAQALVGGMQVSGSQAR